MNTIGTEFDPKKYQTYNSSTGEAEPQFKEYEDLPAKYQKYFQKAPGGGYVRIEAVEDTLKAQCMAEAENRVRSDMLKQIQRIRKKIERLENEAVRQNDLTSETYEAGRKRRD